MKNHFLAILGLVSLCLMLVFGCADRISNPSSPAQGGQIAEVSRPSGPGLGLQPTGLAAPFDKLRMPPGFKIDYWAQGVTNARAMALSPKGTLFVGSRSEGKVYALRDTNGDFRADLQYVLLEGLNMPTGVAFRDGSLYVAAVNRILRLDDIENRLSNPPIPVVVTEALPKDDHHGWKYIAFGPDGKLYVPVGAPCNICENEKKPIYASMTRMNPDGSGLEVVQHGIRNTVGFTWHPTTRELWFTDNGRDWMGDDMPACELNCATSDQLHFGYPYCHQGDFLDPKFGKGKKCADYVPPAQKLGAHVAPLGVEFYNGNQFPSTYKYQAIIAEHGSWNRTEKSGYRLSLVRTDGKTCTEYTPFVEGWVDANGEVWGRPVDLEHLPDGSLLVSDDQNDCIYRISY